MWFEGYDDYVRRHFGRIGVLLVGAMLCFALATTAMPSLGPERGAALGGLQFSLAHEKVTALPHAESGPLR